MTHPFLFLTLSYLIDPSFAKMMIGKLLNINQGGAMIIVRLGVISGWLTIKLQKSRKSGQVKRLIKNQISLKFLD